MNFTLPFVSRARYADREREVLELKRELADLRYAHARVVDEINFRSTGFHLDERFVKKDEVQPTAVQPGPEQEEPTGIAGAIHQVGTRPSALRNYLQATADSEHREKEQAYDQKKADERRLRAAELMEEALKSGTAKGQAAQA